MNNESIRGNRMIFADFLKVRYANKIIDDISRERRYYKWVAQNNEFNDNGFEEEEQWESGIEKTDYNPPFVKSETFEVKRYSFKNGKSFVCITKQLDDALPLGRVNGLRFMGMIRNEMDEEGRIIRKTFSQQGIRIRGLLDSLSCGK
ncbi:hypothetical protein Tco_0688443 [Tanacetum coccineum]